MKRPLGVTLSALYKFASGLFWMVFSVWYFSSFERTSTGGSSWAWIVIGVVVLVPTVWFVSVGMGLWRMKNWARILVLVVGAFWAAEFLLKLPGLFLFHRPHLPEFHWYYWLALLWPGPVLNIVLLIYLLLPQVQRSFRESGPPRV
jgi:hypothetical protein